MQISFRSNTYALGYMTCEVILHGLALFSVLELYRIALAKHGGLASFGRTTVWALTGVVTLLAFVSTSLDRDIPRGQSVIVHRFVTVQKRTLEMAILLFLLLIALFISWFPVKMQRNTVLSIVGFSVFYFVRAGGLLAVNLMSHAQLEVINAIMMSVSSAFLFAWAVVLRPEEASQEVVTGHTWDPEAMGQLSDQLDSINTALARLGRS